MQVIFCIVGLIPVSSDIDYGGGEYQAPSVETPMYIVQNSESDFAIVTADGADECIQTAANELQTYLKKISGAELEIVAEADFDGENAIVLGETELQKSIKSIDRSQIKEDGFVLYSDGNYLLIAGEDTWSTSLIVVALLLFSVSDSALKPLVTGYAPEELGTVLKYQDILHCFADPIIMLFIGGFMLAIAATKYGLDAKIAKVLLKPFGTQSRFVLLGFIVVTGLFSAFISNTATAAMMLAFLAPVLKALPADGKGKIGLALAIPVAANIGGMATPIGTPPNGIVLKYLEPMGLGMGFGEWIAFMGPITIVLLLIAWVILLKLFPNRQWNFLTA